MKIYRVVLNQADGESHGYQYFSNKREAEQCAKTWRNSDPPGNAEIYELNIDANKEGILDALNSYGSHADNG